MCQREVRFCLRADSPGTITRLRVLSRNQQLIRLISKGFSASIRSPCTTAFQQALGTIGALVLSD